MSNNAKAFLSKLTLLLAAFIVTISTHAQVKLNTGSSRTLSISFSEWITKSGTDSVTVEFNGVSLGTISISSDATSRVANPSGYWSNPQTLTIPISDNTWLPSINITCSCNLGFIQVNSLSYGTAVDPKSALHKTLAVISDGHTIRPEWVNSGDTLTYNFCSGNAPVTVNLTDGWNLIGNSSDQTLTIPSTVLGDASRVVSVWMWDATNASWLFYSPAMSFQELQTYTSSRGYRILTQITPGNGFWVNAKAAFALALQNNNFNSPTLATGWSLATTGCNVTPAAFVASGAAANITSLWAWDKSTSTWLFYSPNLDAIGTLESYIAGKDYLSFANRGKTLGGGEGFWVNGVAKSAESACDYIPSATITYPPEYQGAFPLPTPKGRLPANITRTMNLKDVDVFFEKPATISCTDKNAWRTNALIETLNRVQQLGVERIWIYNYASIADISEPTWSFNELDYSLPRSVMQTIVKEAHKRNIKVYYAFQLAFYCDAHGACFDPLNLSSQDLSRLLDAHKKQIVNDGMFGAQIGLDGLKAEIDAFSPTRLMNYDLAIKERYVGSVTSTIDELRKVFPGKITYGQYFSIFDNRIISMLDELVLGLFLGKKVTPFDVENWKKATADDISSFKRQIQLESGNLNINVPINWEIYVESSKGFYGSPWIDDFCTTTMIAQHNCPQNSETTDFSMQAVATEGALEALSTQYLFTSSSISFCSYFYTDDLVPTAVGGAFVFPNINGSIRNKPAESIVKYWFGK